MNLSEVDQSTLTTFLDAVAADWYDDTPRLVLADWLQDRDVRHLPELIRLSCEKSRPLAEGRSIAVIRQEVRSAADKCVPRKYWVADRYTLGADARPVRPRPQIPPAVTRGFLETRVFYFGYGAPPVLDLKDYQDATYWLTGAAVVCAGNRRGAEWRDFFDRPETARLKSLEFRRRSPSALKAGDTLYALLDRATCTPRLTTLNVKYDDYAGTTEWLDSLMALLKRGTRLTELSLPANPDDPVLWDRLCQPGFSTLCSLNITPVARRTISSGLWRKVLFESHFSPDVKFYLASNFGGDANFTDVVRADVANRGDAYVDALRGKSLSQTTVRHASMGGRDSLSLVYQAVLSTRAAFAKLFPQRAVG